MKLYTIQDKSKLKSISNIKFDLEKDIQVLFENNLEELFNLEFVKSEFSIKNFAHFLPNRIAIRLDNHTASNIRVLG